MLADANILEILFFAVTFLASGYLGLMVYLRNPSSWTNRFFALLAFNVVIYSVVHFLSLHPPVSSPQNQLLWIRIDMAVGAFLAPLLFMLVYNFPRTSFSIPRKYIWPLVILMLSTAVISLTPLVFESIEYPNGEPVPVPGPGIALYFIDFIGLILLSFGCIIIKYKKARGRERVRLGYFLFGVLGTFSILGIATLIFVVIFKTSAAVFLGPLSFLVLISLFSYSIVKHHFFDIRPIIARATSFFVLFAVAAIAYNIAITFLIQKTLNVDVSATLFVSGTILAILAFSSFPLLEKVMRHITDRVFFRGEYNTDKLLAELTRTMAENIELKPMMGKVLSLLTKEMRLTKALFIVVDDHQVTEIKGVGYDAGRLESLKLEKLFHQTSEFGDKFIFEQLEEGALKKIFRELDITIAIPLRVKAREVAILILGPKASGEVYNKKDMDLLDIFSQEAAIAIQNSKSYEELKKLNAQLEQKVQERTKEVKKSQERELKKAKEVSELKDEFLNITAHELKGPLMPISTQVQLLLDNAFGEVNEEQEESLDMIKRNLDSLEKLIRDLLDITRMRTHKFKIEPEKVKLEKLIEQMAQNYKEQAKEFGVELTVQAEDLPEIYADPKRITQVLNDIVDNAFKFTPKGGKINIRAEKQKNSVLVRVEDTGAGISKENLDKIFASFFQADTSITRKTGGVGLGLVISKGIIEEHGGKIWAESDGEGKGSAFCFTLPIK